MSMLQIPLSVSLHAAPDALHTPCHRTPSSLGGLHMLRSSEIDIPFYLLHMCGLHSFDTPF